MPRPPDEDPERPPTWVAIIALKWLSRAKSRLGVGSLRPAVALAMARDTVGSVLAAGSVDSAVLVGSDPAVHAAFAGVARVRRVHDPGGGLDSAVGAGVRAARLSDPTVGVVVLHADLPALLPDDLDVAIALAGGARRSFVADRARTGTSALFLKPGVPLVCRFGAGSRSAHRRLGLTEIAQPELASLRLDVDSLDDLRDAAQLGLGPHTARLLGAAGHPGRDGGPAPETTGGGVLTAGAGLVVAGGRPRR